MLEIARRRYWLFGLDIASDFDLPSLVAGADDGIPDVVIERAGPGAAVVANSGAARIPGGVRFHIPTVAEFVLLGGRRIVVHPIAGATIAHLELYLLGSAMGLLLQQRGVLALHANALSDGQGAVAFVGRSGAGKSTLAAALCRRGFALLSDDVCAITDVARSPMVQPGIPRIKLWQDAAEHDGHATAELPRVRVDLEKFALPAGRFATGPAPLRRIYVLGEPAGHAAPAAYPLRARQAAEALVANTYRKSRLHLAGDPTRHLHDCMALVERVPIFALDRPWGLDREFEVIEWIAAHLTA